MQRVHQRVKWTAKKLGLDGMIETESVVLQQPTPSEPWKIEEHDNFPFGVSGEEWNSEWCPIIPGQTYDGPDDRTVTVEVLDDRPDYPVWLAVEITLPLGEILNVNLSRDSLVYPWSIASPEGCLGIKQGAIFDLLWVDPDTPEYEATVPSGAICKVRVRKIPTL